MAAKSAYEPLEIGVREASITMVGSKVPRAIVIKIIKTHEHLFEFVFALCQREGDVRRCLLLAGSDGNPQSPHSTLARCHSPNWWLASASAMAIVHAQGGQAAPSTTPLTLESRRELHFRDNGKCPDALRPVALAGQVPLA